MANTHETILYVNLNALEVNFRFLKSKLPKRCKTIAVVKAYAYGLGDIEISKHLQQLGVHAFWVADFEEGIQLRKEGITKPIIVANPGFKSLDAIVKHDLEPVLFNHKLLDLYADCGQEITVHLKFNTGMNRYGFDHHDLENIIAKLRDNPQLHIGSICSHLSSSNDSSKDAFSNQQRQEFKTLCISIEKALNTTIPYHIMNSNGSLRFTTNSEEWVRLGIALYGGIEHPNLTQIFSLKSVISQVRSIKKGQSVGYQNSFVAKKDMKIAIIPVGYADGLNRKLGNKNGQVFINDYPCQIVGDISMDSFAADISSLNISEGHEVVIFSPKYSVSKLANDLDTISYEIMATLNRRIKRIYIKE
ncbi:alanine racemase [Flavobacteriales bacterium]|nr:alanine racemase [Flavobacteriales bacterium]